jgi:hypothetical protein
MDNNIVKDINELYLNQVVNRELEEAKKPNDGNLANNYPPYDEVTYGDVVAGRLGKDQMGGKRKKITKEGFSNWRNDLSEVISDVQLDTQVKEKQIKNKIKTSAIGSGIQIPEAVKNLGGTLIEMNEIEDFEDVFDDLSESDIFFLTDQLIEEVVEEVFFECIQEGCDILNIQNILLESLEISSQILSEAKVTLGHDTKIKSDRLEKVKTAVKNVGKKIIRGAGYAAGSAVRGAKALGKELRAGYRRGRTGAAAAPSSSDSSSSSSSYSGQSASSRRSGESQSSGSSRPGLLGRIASKLGRGLRKIIHKGAKAVERGASSVAHRTADRPKVTQGKSVETQERPSVVHSKSGVRSSIPRSGIGGGKRIEVAGSGKTEKKEPKIKKVSVKDVTPNKPKTPVGTAENPRVGQPGPENTKPKANPKVKTTTIKTDGPKNPRRARRRKSGPSYDEVKAQIDRKEEESKIRQEKRKKANQLLKDLAKEELQLSEMSVSKDQQRLFGLALSVKRGETSRSGVSAEVLKIVDTMSEKKIRDFAKTSHEGLPKKIQTKEEVIKNMLIDKMIKKIEEQALEMQPKIQSFQQKPDQQQKKFQQQQDRVKQQEIQILQRKLQTLRSSPKGVDPSITA